MPFCDQRDQPDPGHQISIPADGVQGREKKRPTRKRDVNAAPRRVRQPDAASIARRDEQDAERDRRPDRGLCAPRLTEESEQRDPRWVGEHDGENVSGQEGQQPGREPAVQSYRRVGSETRKQTAARRQHDHESEQAQRHDAESGAELADHVAAAGQPPAAASSRGPTTNASASTATK